MKTIFLIWYLRIVALVQIGLWGLSHLFYPAWYMTTIAGKDPAMLTTFNILLVNEIGVMALAAGVVTLLASFNPVKNFNISVLLILMGLGSMGVTLYHILVRQASQEWGHIITVLAQLVVLAILYPWKEGYRYIQNS